MKTTTFYGLLLASCFQLTVVAQESNIDWGTQVEVDGTVNAYIPLGWVDDKFYCIQIDGKEGSLLTVKDNMDLESQKVILTDQKKFDTDLMFLYNGKIQMLYSEYDYSSNNIYIRANSFTLLNKPGGMKSKLVATVENDGDISESKSRYYFSQDSSTMLFLHEYYLSGKENAKIGLYVVDVSDNMAPVWDATVTLPYIGRQYKLATGSTTSAALQNALKEEFKIITAAVNNEGQVIVYGAKLIEKSGGDKFYEIHSFDFSSKNEVYEDKVLDLGNKFVSNIRAKFINDKELLVAGFYNEKEEDGSSTGLTGAFIEVLQPGEILNGNQLTKEIDAEVKAAITPTGALVEMADQNQLDYYSIKDLILNPDGSGYVIAEQRAIVSDGIKTSFYFHHLLLYRFNEQKEISWFASVPKLQMTSISIGPYSKYQESLFLFGRKYNSYVAMEQDGKLYLLYNDHKKNGDARTVKDTHLMVGKNSAIATLLTIDEEGEWTKEALFSGKEADVILETSSSIALPGVGFLICAEKYNKLQFGILKL